MPGLNQFDPGGDPFALLHGGAAAALTLDLDFGAGPPLVGLTQDSSILEAGATEWLHVLLNAVDNGTGRTYDLTALFAAGAVKMAVVTSDPVSTDWQVASALSHPEGLYARIVLGPGGALNPGVGTWRVEVQISAGGETLERRAAGLLLVR